MALNEDLNNLLSWSYTNKFVIHPEKTEYELFGTQQCLAVADELHFLLGEKLAYMRALLYKYLGVITDEHLNFKGHARKLSAKVLKEWVFLEELEEL